VTNAPPTGEQEPQWQQPSFSPPSEPKPAPVEAPVVFGSVLVPRGRVAPPSVAETVFATVSGVVWPVMIVLALMGVMNWWAAILTAIIASAVLGNLRGHLKARRKALGHATTISPEDTNRQR
jgi:hypothetical protein